MPLVIELKNRWSRDRRLEREVATTLTDYSGPAAVMSFDPTRPGNIWSGNTWDDGTTIRYTD